jgi:hypothetical protein
VIKVWSTCTSVVFKCVQNTRIVVPRWYKILYTWFPGHLYSYFVSLFFLSISWTLQITSQTICLRTLIKSTSYRTVFERLSRRMSRKFVVKCRATTSCLRRNPSHTMVNGCLSMLSTVALGRVLQVKPDRVVERHGMRWWQSGAVGRREGM